MDRVLVVMVTYNRKKLLERSLKAIFSQTTHISGVFILDNASNDGTEEVLRKFGFLSTVRNINNEVLVENSKNNVNLYYYRNSINAGGAGGFSKAVKLSRELDYDYLWIMDDDVKPEEKCLENLLTVIHKYNVGAVVPNRNCKNFKDCPTVELDLRAVSKYFMEKRKKRVKPPFSEETYSIKTFAFEGPLIDVEIVKKAGIPKAEYFLLYDDTDYAQRILRYTDILFVTTAYLERQLPVPRIKKNEKISYTWKDYYSIRNNMIFDREYGRTFGVKYISPRLMFIHLLINSLRGKNRKNNLRIVLRAYRDAMGKKMGKRFNPNY